MKLKWKIIVPFCILLLSLATCSVVQNGYENQFSSVTGATSGVFPQAAQFETTEKINPGCRSNLPYPLKMTGESHAIDFSQWSAYDIDKNLITEDILKDSKYTLVSIWMTYCSTHIADLTVLQEIFEGYQRSDLNIIGIVASAQNQDGNVNEYEVDYVRFLLEQTGAKFKQLIPSNDLIAIHLININILPEYIILDSDGNIVKGASIGSYSSDELSDTIDQMLKN